jgi:hypothetical protein
MKCQFRIERRAWHLLGLMALLLTKHDSIAAPVKPEGLDRGSEIAVQKLGTEPRLLTAKAGEAREFTWWLPPKADAYVLPISAGLNVKAADAGAAQWLRQGSPWDLRELPLLGARYGERTLVLIVPWPHYAELVFGERVGVRFSFPDGRNNATPCNLVAQWAGPEPIEAARAFREWRRDAPDPGATSRARSQGRRSSADRAAFRRAALLSLGTGHVQPARRGKAEMDSPRPRTAEQAEGEFSRHALLDPARGRSEGGG